MCNFIFRGFVLPLLLGLYLSGQPALSAEEPTGDEIVQRADEVMIGDSAKYDSVMVVKRPKVQDKIYKFRTYFKERGKRVLLRMFAPPREIGKDLLLVDGNMWQYIPRIERSVRIAGTQRFFGGDFNNSDLLKVSLVDDYQANLISTTEIEGEMCYYLKLKAKNQSATYDRVDYWVRTESYIPFREAYFTLAGKKMKILTYYDIGRLDNRNRPRRLVMQSSLTPNHLTTINIVRAEYDKNISGAIFTRTYLERKRH